jgi:diguanylate cyclase (GGDEF) domain
MSTEQSRKIEQGQTWRMLLVGIVVLAVALLASSVGEPLGSVQQTLKNPGLYIDITSLVFLIFMYWNTTRVRLAHFALRWVRYGFLLWIAGSTFDVMDEIVHQPRWMGYYCEDMLRLAGMLATTVGIYRIIRRINVLYVDARSKSLRDELTQLPNRRFFIDTIKAKEDSQVALMILDIDFFKRINDTWGHLMGDEILFSLGKQLTNLSSDTVLPARIGGEEFAIIVEGRSTDDIQRLAQSVLDTARTILINGDQPLSVSIGVGARKQGEAQDAFIRKVDEALYRAKNNGRGRIEWAE